VNWYRQTNVTSGLAVHVMAAVDALQDPAISLEEFRELLI